MESAGARLKQIRLQKGISLEEVHKKTKIHQNILRSLEEDNLASVSDVYLKGFLKIYCKFLNVDPAEYIPDYKEPQGHVYFQVPTNEEEPRLSLRDPAARLKAVLVKVPWPRIIAVAVGLLLIVGLVQGVRGCARRSREASLVRRAQQEEAAAAAARATQKSPAAKPQAPAVAPKPAKPEATPLRLSIRAKEDCFVTVTADNTVLFKSTLRKKRSESWTAKDRMELDLGNAAAVELEVNGRTIPPLSKRKRAIKNIVITKDGIHIP